MRNFRRKKRWYDERKWQWIFVTPAVIGAMAMWGYIWWRLIMEW